MCLDAAGHEILGRKEGGVCVGKYEIQNTGKVGGVYAGMHSSY